MGLDNKSHAQQPHTLPSRSSQPHQPKLVNKCVFPNARTEKKKVRLPNN